MQFVSLSKLYRRTIVTTVLIRKAMPSAVAVNSRGFFAWDPLQENAAFNITSERPCANHLASYSTSTSPCTFELARVSWKEKIQLVAEIATIFNRIHFSNWVTWNNSDWLPNWAPKIAWRVPDPFTHERVGSGIETNLAERYKARGINDKEAGWIQESEEGSLARWVGGCGGGGGGGGYSEPYIARSIPAEDSLPTTPGQTAGYQMQRLAGWLRACLRFM